MQHLEQQKLFCLVEHKNMCKNVFYCLHLAYVKYILLQPVIIMS